MFSKRRDAKLIKGKNIGFDRFLYYLKPRRSDSEVYISREIDVTNLKKYIDLKKESGEKITYFHAFSTAITKVIYNRPYLNRFIIKGNKYERNEVKLSFVAKTDFTDDSNEFMNVVTVDKEDNLNTISKKITGDVEKIRSNKGNSADNLVITLGKLPKWLFAFIVWFIKRLDNNDLLPSSLTNNSLYHSTIILSNLGSIHCGAIYHNLTNFGTNSILATMGEVKEVAKVIDGKIEKRWVCDFGITLDERIADGVYYAKAVNLLEYILDNPKMLEGEINDKINME